MTGSKIIYKHCITVRNLTATTTLLQKLFSTCCQIYNLLLKQQANFDGLFK